MSEARPIQQLPDLPEPAIGEPIYLDRQVVRYCSQLFEQPITWSTISNLQKAGRAPAGVLIKRAIRVYTADQVREIARALLSMPRGVNWGRNQPLVRLEEPA